MALTCVNIGLDNEVGSNHPTYIPCQARSRLSMASRPGLQRALGVLPGEVSDAAGGREALERGVSPVMVVGVEPGVKRGAALGFCGVGAGVGQGAVESFDLAAGLGPAGAGALVGDAQVRAGGGPVPGR
jgi:hypothetical protein